MTDLPPFTEFFNPLIAALRELGGSAQPEEAYALIAEREGLTEEQLAIENQAGVSRFKNRVAWARFYLVRSGYIDDSRRGVWNLTPLGLNCPPLSHQDAVELRRRVQARQRDAGTPEDRGPEVAPTPRTVEPSRGDDVDLAPPETPSGLGHRDEVREALFGMSPSGFERFCQRFLREAGFESVQVTGRSGDGGIDGEGILRVNPLVSFKVIFQCKRHSSQVGSPQIRDFRGAMAGRADRGLFITTSSFSRDAKREAVRDGADPMELLDGEGILDLIEELELGIARVNAFVVDTSFFQQFC